MANRWGNSVNSDRLNFGGGPTPRSLQSRPLPSGDISESKGPGPARNCDTEPQPAFPVFLRLPFPASEGAEQLSPPSPGRGQAARTPGVETGRLLGLPGSFRLWVPCGGCGGPPRGEEVGGGLGWKEVASALDGLGWEAVDLGTSPEDLRGCV